MQVELVFCMQQSKHNFKGSMQIGDVSTHTRLSKYAFEIDRIPQPQLVAELQVLTNDPLGSFKEQVKIQLRPSTESKHFQLNCF